MTKESLLKIRDGAFEIQKECKNNFMCETCFFYMAEDNIYKTRCKLAFLCANGYENFGKNISLQYLK